MELGKIGRTVGRGATLGFSFRASMTPVIVAMFCCTCCICVVAMWQGCDDNDGEVLMRVCRFVMGVEEEKTEGRKESSKFGTC